MHTDDVKEIIRQIFGDQATNDDTLVNWYKDKHELSILAYAKQQAIAFFKHHVEFSDQTMYEKMYNQFVDHQHEKMGTKLFTTPKLLSGKKLQVHHFAQLPCKPFCVDVKDEYDAYRIMQILANQHLFLEANHIIPDYSNVLTVVMWDEEENTWLDYYNDAQEMEWRDFELCYLRNRTT